MKCVKKEPGRYATIIDVSHPTEVFEDVCSFSPYNLQNTLQFCYDANFAAKRLEPNIVHPRYPGYYEICGDVVVFRGDGTRNRSLTTIEATQICIALTGLQDELRTGKRNTKVSDSVRTAWYSLVAAANGTIAEEKVS